MTSRITGTSRNIHIGKEYVAPEYKKPRKKIGKGKSRGAAANHRITMQKYYWKNKGVLPVKLGCGCELLNNKVLVDCGKEYCENV